MVSHENGDCTVSGIALTGLDGGGALTVTIKNEPVYIPEGEITVRKVNEKGQPLPGVTFLLEYSVDNGGSWNPVTSRGEDEPAALGGCTSVGLTDGKLITGGDGLACFNGLCVETDEGPVLYRLTETATLPGYSLLSAPAFEGSLPESEDFRYCYELGIIVKHPNRTKRVSYLLRDDVIKLDRYIAETKMLIANKIETIEDLDAYRDDLNQKIDRLGAERKELRNQLKKATRRHDENEMVEIQNGIKRVSKELKKARKEVDYCADVAERSEQIHQNLLELTKDKEDLRKERNLNEYPGRSSRSGR